MSRVTKLVVLLATVVMTGCGLVDDGVNRVSSKTDLQDSLSDTLKSDSVKIASAKDTTTVTLPVVAGNTYKITIKNKDNADQYHMGVSVCRSTSSFYAKPLGDSVAEFTAKMSETLTLKFYVEQSDSAYTGLYDFSYSIEEIEPVAESKLTGKWLLIKESYTAFEKTTSLSFTAGSAFSLDAYEVIEFRNDSIFHFYFSENADSVVAVGDPLSESEYSHFKNTFTANTVTFKNTVAAGSLELVYQKYSGQIDDLPWGSKTYKIPSQFHGTWYLSYGAEIEYDENDGVLSTDSNSVAYASAGESHEIRVITADSVIIYNRNDGDVTVHRYGASFDMWMYQLGKVSGSAFSYSAVVCGGTTGSSWAASLEGIYTKYTGAIPPKEWQSTVDTTTLSDEWNLNGGLSGNWVDSKDSAVYLSFVGNKMNITINDYVLSDTSLDSTVIAETYLYGLNKSKTELYYKTSEGDTGTAPIVITAGYIELDGLILIPFKGTMPSASRGSYIPPVWSSNRTVSVPLRAESNTAPKRFLNFK